METGRIPVRHTFLISFWCLLLAAAALAIVALTALPIGPASAQGEGRVQTFTGEIEPSGRAVFVITDLRQGQTIYAYARTISGNFDPILAILDADADVASLMTASAEAIQAAASSQPESVASAIDAIRDQFTLAWDDDSGEGYAAALEFEIPEDGDYQLLLGSAFASLGRQTLGNYELVVGLNAPAVLSGEAEPSGLPFVERDTAAGQTTRRVQEITGAFAQGEMVQALNLIDLNPDDTLYVYTQPIGGAAAPRLILRDFGGKGLEASNLDGSEETAVLSYTFTEHGKDTVLAVSRPGSSDAGEDAASEVYRLLLGVNAPEVLSGQAAPTELPVLRQAIAVQVGLKLQQIVQVNQQDEFFNVVGSLQMEWDDPALAFSPDTCQCQRKIYTEKEFDRFLADVGGQWPDFTFFNQQGNRWIQNRVAVLEPDGHAAYFERFSTNLQTDFDFRQYPFDRQQFPIRVDMLYPEDRYYFTDLEGFSEISQEHGEDEFIITGFDTTLSSEESSTQNVVSRFTFSYEAPRHLNYYFFRIFIPILLIIMISWWTFFLKDYNKRIEVAAGNVLLFIAFSFSLAENYPRLGYMTFMDAIMAIVFVINALVLIYNVYMRRLEMAGKADAVERIDNKLDWLYPLLYIASLLVVVVLFFVLPAAA